MLDGGRGDDILVAGAAANTSERETLRDMYGNNTFFGDFGKVEGARILETITKASSIASDHGGQDTVEAGRGNDWIIAGEGNDIINSGLGGDVILGDNGVISVSDSEISAVYSVNAGDDTITIGEDDPSLYGGSATPADLVDLVIGGSGNDTINAANGGLIALGDTGVITINPTALNALRIYTPLPDNPTDQQIADDTAALNLISAIATSIESTARATDGNDTITTTGGDALLVLGGGADNADLGAGESYIIADDGRIDYTANATYTGADVTLSAAASLAASVNDTIRAASGRNIVIVGAGQDHIDLTQSNDDNVVLGDRGMISHDTTGAELVLKATSGTQSDDDVDTVLLGSGNDTAILGGGGDSLTATGGDNAVIGDSGTITVDETLVAESLDVLDGGDDTITTGAGNDTIIGGAANDIIHAGAGYNRILGDSGTINPTTLVSRTQTSDGDNRVEPVRH